jgi:hypothetical protein
MKLIISGALTGLTLAALATLAPAAHADVAHTVTVRQADLVSVLSDTRTAGHVDFLKDGLHVQTDDTTSNAKAAEYFPVPTQGLPGSASLTWFGTQPQPGSQIVFDANGATDGDAFNVLVGEPIYGDQFWLTNASSADAKKAAPSCDGTDAVATESSDALIGEGHCTGGNGSAWHGTLAEWQQALTGAQVYAAGFSLGSGVKGDGVIHDIQVGDTDYTFTSEPLVTKIPVTGTSTATEVVRPHATTLNLRFVTNALGANQAAGKKLTFKVTDNDEVLFRDTMGAGEKSSVKLRFAEGTGRHTVQILKNGAVDRTFKINMGH